MPMIPKCLSTQAEQHHPEIMAGRWVVRLPGGPFPMGSEYIDKKYHDATRHVVNCPGPLHVAVGLVEQGEYADVMGQSHKDDDHHDHPVICTYFDAEKFMRRLNLRYAREGHQVGFLTEVEAEFMLRGRPQNIRLIQDTLGSKKPSDLRDHLRRIGNPVENLIAADPIKNPAAALALGTNICGGIDSPQFDTLINGPTEVFGWFVHPSRSGKLDEDIWHGKDDTAPVDLRKRVNDYGVSDAGGNVAFWCGDVYDKDFYLKHPDKIENRPEGEEDNRIRVVRGGFFTHNEVWFRAASRLHPGHYAGLRLAVVPPGLSG